VLAAVALTALCVFLALQVSSMLRDAEQSKVALIAETESYTTRSKLVRSVDSMLDSVRDLHAYWEEYSALPSEVWPQLRGLEWRDVPGISTILWFDESRDTRYLHTLQHAVLNYRPGDDEWRALEPLRRQAAAISDEAILGPFPSSDGHRFHVVVNAAPYGGTLIAVVDARAALQELLRDESPGYAIDVTWEEAVIYRRGSPATDIPSEWVREGQIRNSMGVVWKVVHAPTAGLADSLVTPALAAVLPMGLLVSGLLGLLVVENGRVNVRAAAAGKAEQRLAKLNRELEQQVAQRTEELAKRTADLETITESVAHDLRNPLNAISVNVQVLEQQLGESLGQEGQEAMERTTSGISRMAEILDRLVGLSVATRATFEPETLNMTELVAGEFERLRSVEPPPAVDFRLEPLPEVQGDSTLVQILVLNLLSNALQSTRVKSDRRISVSCSTQGGIPTFCIRDNGRGLDSEHAKRIFRPFEQLSEGASANGLGLGLTIASRVVKRHGGQIWAEGVAGREAAIYFTLEPGPGPGQAEGKASRAV
jgi:signal transduction histidine kinase